MCSPVSLHEMDMCYPDTIYGCVETKGSKNKVLLYAPHRSTYTAWNTELETTWSTCRHRNYTTSEDTLQSSLSDCHLMFFLIDTSIAAPDTTVFCSMQTEQMCKQLSVIAQSDTGNLVCRHSEGRRWRQQTSHQRCVPSAASEPLWSRWNWHTLQKPADTIDMN